MTNLPVLVSDLGGVIYSFSATFDAKEHEKNFKRNLEWYLINDKELAKRVIQEPEQELALTLEIEQVSVKKWFDGFKSDGVLPVYFIPGAIEILLEDVASHKIVIVSTSKVETSKQILQEAIRSVGGNVALVDNFDIYNMSMYGSKKESINWGRIFANYTNIKAVIEDDPKNLLAACEAAKKVSPDVQQYPMLIRID